jgi:hypothetical protein
VTLVLARLLPRFVERYRKVASLSRLRTGAAESIEKDAGSSGRGASRYRLTSKGIDLTQLGADSVLRVRGQIPFVEQQVDDGVDAGQARAEPGRSPETVHLCSAEVAHP